MTVATVSGRTEAHTIPVGVIIPWAHSSTIPSGWLACDGSQISISAYGELYSVLTVGGTIFPYGANVGNNFLLPDINSGQYIPSGPKLVRGPLAFNYTLVSGLGTKTSATTHSHTWDLGATVTQNNADGSHSHNANKAMGSTAFAAHTATSNLGATTTNAGGANMGSGGAQTASFRVHGHVTNAQNTTENHSTHNHTVNTGANIATTTHSHTWTTSGNSYTPTAINTYVDHMVAQYIILAKPQGLVS